MGFVLMVLCAFVALLAFGFAYLIARFTELKAEVAVYKDEVEHFEDAVSRLTSKSAELEGMKESVEDEVIAQLTKRMDDGFQKMMAWNPFDTGGESEGN